MDEAIAGIVNAFLAPARLLFAQHAEEATHDANALPRDGDAEQDAHSMPEVMCEVSAEASDGGFDEGDHAAAAADVAMAVTEKEADSTQLSVEAVLPPECLGIIASFLDGQSLALLSSCSRTLHTIAENPDLWRALLRDDLHVELLQYSSSRPPSLELTAPPPYPADAAAEPRVRYMRALEALAANECFYAIFRAAQMHAMQGMWLEDARWFDELPETGTPSGPERPSPPWQPWHISLLEHDASSGGRRRVRCRHPGRASLHGYEAVVAGWNGILGGPAYSRHASTGTVYNIWPEGVRCAISPCARHARVFNYERLNTGLIPAVNHYAYIDGVWRMVVHEALEPQRQNVSD